jgi:hypothetical protein
MTDSDTPALDDDHRCLQQNGWRINGEDTACHDGELYGPCTSEYCNGQCEAIGSCTCDCHEDGTDG